MQLGRCPICHHRIDLQALIQDDSARQLVGLLAKQPKEVAVPLVSYLGLFRPAKSDLTNTRALKLATEVLAMSGPLGTALEKTVEAIMTQRSNNRHFKPMANHNYLKQVLETLGAPSQKKGYQKPPGQLKGEQHKAAEIKQMPAGAREMFEGCGVKTRN